MHAVVRGQLERDREQEKLVRQLDRLATALGTRALARKKSALGWLFARRSDPLPTPRGIYVWGGVGRGKTMLMDMFFEAVPVKRKRRVHFHAFMSDVHSRIHARRAAIKRGAAPDDDPVPHVAADLAEEAVLLCFDEFQVTDIADAMILRRLFEHLLAAGVVIIATSNTPPEDLYKGGLNRALFLPFISALQEKLDIVHLESRTDYRLEKLASAPVWLVPASDEADRALTETFERLTGAPHGAPETLRVFGRDIAIREARKNVARFTFEELCVSPHGPADYLSIAERYQTILIDRIPRLSVAEDDTAKRFVVLIDTLYDHHVHVVASADAEPAELVPLGTHATEFARTASRLMEMRSEEWLSKPHGRAEGRPRDPGTGGLVET
jgi:cell division protein ZapE